MGEHRYTLTSENSELGSAHGCKNGCIYKRDDQESKELWCFARGDLQPKCLTSQTSSTTTLEPTSSSSSCIPNKHHKSQHFHVLFIDCDENESGPYPATDLGHSWTDDTYYEENGMIRF